MNYAKIHNSNQLITSGNFWMDEKQLNNLKIDNKEILKNEKIKQLYEEINEQKNKILKNKQRK